MILKKDEKNVNQETSTTRDDYLAGQQYKITLAAYYKAEKRGFAPGHKLDDWLEAECDILGNPQIIN